MGKLARKLAPPLVDDLVARCSVTSERITINTIPYFKRTLPYYRFNYVLRLYHAWLILTGRALAVQFAQDRYGVKDAD